VLEKIKNEIKANTLYTCKMHEFYYFLNYYHNSDWFGTCAFLYGSFKMQSLNKVRNYRTGNEKSISTILFENSGWHFTSLGDATAIKEKIKSWGHKEFNNPIIISALKYNISHGYDIFRRKNFGRLTFFEPNDALLTPILGSHNGNFNYLIGSRLKKEIWITNFLFSLFFKITLRISRIVNGI
jgi:hypothetical protein